MVGDVVYQTGGGKEEDCQIMSKGVQQLHYLDHVAISVGIQCMGVQRLIGNIIITCPINSCKV
jgi:hypothetical protein